MAGLGKNTASGGDGGKPSALGSTSESKAPISSLEGAVKKVAGSLVLEPEEWDAPVKVGLIVVGDKNCGKSANLADLPRPFGGKTVYISFDAATREGLVTRWGKQWLKDNNVVVYEPTEVRRDPETKEVIWPGYDPARPETAVQVLGMMFRIVKMYEESGDADNIILDHFQYGHEDIGVNVARVQSKPPLEVDQTPQWQHYAMRANLLKQLVSAVRRTARHCYAVTGYKDEEYTEDVDTGKKNSRGKAIIEKAVKVRDARWLKKYQAPFTVSVEMTKEAGDDGSRRFPCKVMGSKNPAFPDGRVIDLFGSGISRFWEERDALGDMLLDEGDPESDGTEEITVEDDDAVEVEA